MAPPTPRNGASVPIALPLLSPLSDEIGRGRAVTPRDRVPRVASARRRTIPGDHVLDASARRLQGVTDPMMSRQDRIETGHLHEAGRRRAVLDDEEAVDASLRQIAVD